MMPAPPIHTRPMKRKDLRAVMQIERESFKHPWTQDQLACRIRQRRCTSRIAEWGDEPLGFLIYEIHPTRLHIVSIAVAEDNRNFGVGSALLRYLIDKLSPNRRDRILLEVPETNLAAQLFFKLHGFRAISVLREFYDDCESAYLMQRRYSEPVIRPASRGVTPVPRWIP